jgi:hypothetical protein
MRLALAELEPTYAENIRAWERWFRSRIEELSVSAYCLDTERNRIFTAEPNRIHLEEAAIRYEMVNDLAAERRRRLEQDRIRLAQDYVRWQNALQSIPKVVSLAGRPDDTRAGRRITSYLPDNSAASCPSGSKDPATEIATRMSALPPTAGRGVSSARPRPSSPRQCDGCETRTHARRPPPRSARCHNLCPDTGAAAAPPSAWGAPPRWRRGWRPAAGGHLCSHPRCRQQAARLAPQQAGSA